MGCRHDRKGHPVRCAEANAPAPKLCRERTSPGPPKRRTSPGHVPPVRKCPVPPSRHNDRLLTPRSSLDNRKSPGNASRLRVTVTAAKSQRACAAKPGPGKTSGQAQPFTTGPIQQQALFSGAICRVLRWAAATTVSATSVMSIPNSQLLRTSRYDETTPVRKKDMIPWRESATTAATTDNRGPGMSRSPRYGGDKLVHGSGGISQPRAE